MSSIEDHEEFEQRAERILHSIIRSSKMKYLTPDGVIRLSLEMAEKFDVALNEHYEKTTPIRRVGNKCDTK